MRGGVEDSISSREFGFCSGMCVLLSCIIYMQVGKKLTGWVQSRKFSGFASRSNGERFNFSSYLSYLQCPWFKK